MTPQPIKEMDSAINALYLELPIQVADDVKQRWKNAKDFFFAELEEYAAQSTQEGGTVEAIVVWKDGTYKIVESNSLFEYENDKDWLTTINLTEYASQVSATDKKRIEELEAEVQQLTGLSNAAIRMEFELAFKNQELEKEVERLRG